MKIMMNMVVPVIGMKVAAKAMMVTMMAIIRVKKLCLKAYKTIY